MRSITRCVLLSLFALAMVFTVPACVPRHAGMPPSGPACIRRSITFDASSLNLRDADAREEFIAGLRRALATQDAPLQSAHYQWIISHAWISEGAAQRKDYERIDVFSLRQTPFMFSIAGHERPLRHHLSAQLNLAEGRGEVEFDPDNSTPEQRMVVLELAKKPKDANGVPVGEAGVRRERAESFRRFKQALLDFLPDAKYREQESRRR